MASPASSNDLQTQWARVRGRLRSEFGEAAYRNWLKKLTLVGLRGPELQLAVPTRFIRDWIGSNYSDRLLALWVTENPAVRTIELVVEAGSKHVEEDGAAAGRDLSPAGSGGRGEAGPPEIAKGILIHSLDPRFTFETFVVGKPNELAYAAAERVADLADRAVQPAVPLWRRRPRQDPPDARHRLAHPQAAARDRRVIYLSAEKFMYQFVRALRFKDTMAFKELFRSVDVLMIDDVQFISGKDSTQEEFFHTFNALVDQNRQIVISADKSPVRPRRHGGADEVAARLGPGRRHPSHHLRAAARHPPGQGRADEACRCPRKVLEFLAHKITSNVRELEGALNRIAAHATLIGRADHASRRRRSCCTTCCAPTSAG